MGDNETPSGQPASDETPSVQPGGGGPEWTRRNFMYGSAAAAAGAVFLRGGEGRSKLRPAGLRLPPGLAARAHIMHPLTGTSGSFSLGQIGPAVANTTSVALTLSSVHTGSLLVATLMSADASTAGAFGNPLNNPPAGWQQAKAVPGPSGSGRAEIWYFAGTPDSPGSSSGTVSATFTTSTGTQCRGVMTEFSVPSPNMMAMLDAGGQASGSSGGSFDVTAGSGNVGNALGIAVAADFFSSAVSGTWTKPATSGTTWTALRTLGGTVTDPWAAWYDLSLTAGVPGSTGVPAVDPGFSITSGQTGYAAAFAAFRLVAFQAVYLDGGEMNNIPAVDPTGQQVILGGDVEGLWRSADYGNNWQATQDGIYNSAWRCTAALAWSQTVDNEVYACVGKNATIHDGGFLVSTDGGVTWSMRAPATSTPGITNHYSFLNFQANDAKVLLPTGVQDDQDRSVGHLIAQSTVSSTNYLYAATWNSGVAISTNDGTAWTQSSGFPSSIIPYLRTLAVDPAGPKGLYTGAWSYPLTGTVTSGGLYYTADATVATPSWSSVTLPTGVTAYSTISDLKVLGSNLYVTFAAGGATAGIYVYNPSFSGSPWVSLNGGLTGSYGLWTSIDGYVSGSDHVIIAACGSGSTKDPTNFTNVVQVVVNPSTGAVISTTDLTGSATITLATLPPNGQSWWHAGASWHNWLGGTAFGNSHLMVNPQNTEQIFVTGQSGCYVTNNGGTDWNVAVNGSTSCGCLGLAADPNVPAHFVICGDDFNFIDVAGDNTGFTATTTVEVFPAPPSDTDGDLLESHGAVFDPRSSITAGGKTYTSVAYVAVSNKYGQADPENGNGEIYWTDSTYQGFHSTDFNVQSGGSGAPVGLCVGISGSSYYLVATTLGNGIWQATIPANPTVAANWSWSQVNTVVGSKGTVVQPIPVVSNAAGTILYCYDRVNSNAMVTTGVWRCTNVGGASPSWTLIWNLTSATWGQSVADTRSGWLAVNPAVTATDELWVSTSESIWKLAGANSGTVGSGITPANMSGSTYFVNGAGGMAFTASTATLYAISLDGITATGTQTPTQLLSLANGGAATAWSSNADPCNSVSSYVAWPGPLVLTAASGGQQTLLIGQQPNFCTYGTVSS